MDEYEIDGLNAAGSDYDFEVDPGQISSVASTLANDINREVFSPDDLALLYEMAFLGENAAQGAADRDLAPIQEYYDLLKGADATGMYNTSSPLAMLAAYEGLLPNNPMGTTTSTENPVVKGVQTAYKPSSEELAKLGPLERMMLLRYQEQLDASTRKNAPLYDSETGDVNWSKAIPALLGVVGAGVGMYGANKSNEYNKSYLNELAAQRRQGEKEFERNKALAARYNIPGGYAALNPGQTQFNMPTWGA